MNKKIRFSFLASLLLVVVSMLQAAYIPLASADTDAKYTWTSPTSFTIGFSIGGGAGSSQFISVAYNGKGVDPATGKGTFTGTVSGTTCKQKADVDYDTKNKTYEVTSGSQVSGDCHAIAGAQLGKGPITDPDGKTGPAAPTGSASGGGDTKDSLDCGQGSWNWLICTGAQLIEKAATGLDGIINQQLTTPVSEIFSGSTGNSYHNAWSSFRIIAVALIIIAGLVMVVSEALGLELLDAYTIRKVLPRLLIAIIAITLSWPIMKFVIQFFDVLGKETESLIAYPFRQLSNNSTGSIIAFTNPLTIIFAAGGLFFVYGFAIFTFVGTFFLAALIAMLIFALRQAAIIILVIMAPIALACYILPNTQKVWQLWRENFLGLMFMYPIITAMIASGRVMSAVAASKGGTLNGFISLIAYFIPYFFLPFAFKLATGVLGNLSGMLNDRSKGGFDRLKNMRGAAREKNMAGMKSGSRFSDRNKLARGFNRTTAGVASGYKGNFGIGERGRQAYDQARRGAAMNEVMKSPGFANIQHDDDALMAATYDSAAKARSGLTARYKAEQMAKGKSAVDAQLLAEKQANRAVNAAQTSVGFGRPQAIAATQQLAATGTGYKNLDDVRQTIARAAGGNEGTLASLAGNINAETKKAGRHDLAPGAGNLIDLSRQAAGMSSSTGYTLAQGNADAWASGSLYSHANDKGANIENAIAHHTSLLRSGNKTDRERAGVFFNEIRSMQPNASGDVKNKISDALDANRGQIDQLYDSKSGYYVGDSDPGIADKSLGTTETMVRDPSTGNYVKDVKSKGSRVENGKERIERLSRTYERPDPNNM